MGGGTGDEDSTLTGSLRKILAGAVVTFVGNVFLRVSGLLERALVARFFDPNRYGQVVLALTVLNLGVIVAMAGLDKGIVRYVPRAEDQTARNGVVGFSLRFSVVSSIVIAGVVFVSAPFLAGVVFNNTELTPVVRIVAAIIPFASVVRMASATARGFEDARVRTLIKDVSLPGIKLLFLGVVLFMRADVLGVASSYLAAYITISVVGLWYIGRTAGFKQRSSIRIEVLRFSFPLFISGGLRIVADTIDTVFIAAFLGTAEVGIYNVGYILSNLVLLAPTLIGVIFMPVMSDYHNQGALSSMDRIYKISSRWILILTTPGFILILLSPEAFISAVFESDYLGAKEVLMVVSSAFFVHVALGLNGATLNVIGDSDFFLFTSLLNASTNIGLNLILIPRLGILGAAIATLASFTLSNVAGGIRLYSKSKIHPASWRTLAVVCLLVGMTVPLSVVVTPLISDLLYVVSTYLLVICLFFPIYVLVFAVPEEKEVLQQRLNNKLRIW